MGGRRSDAQQRISGGLRNALIAHGFIDVEFTSILRRRRPSADRFFRFTPLAMTRSLLRRTWVFYTDQLREDPPLVVGRLKIEMSLQLVARRGHGLLTRVSARSTGHQPPLEMRVTLIVASANSARCIPAQTSSPPDCSARPRSICGLADRARPCADYSRYTHPNWSGE